MDKLKRYVCEGCPSFDIRPCEALIHVDSPAPICCMYGGGTKEWTVVEAHERETVREFIDVAIDFANYIKYGALATCL